MGVAESLAAGISDDAARRQGDFLPVSGAQSRGD